MPKKPPPNWEEIKTRVVVHHEHPEDIAKDYNVAAKTIMNRMYSEDWRAESVRIGQEIRESEIERRKELTGKVGRILQLMTDEILNAIEAKTMGVTVQDGEGMPNRYYSDAWKAIVSDYIKPVEEKSTVEGEIQLLIKGLDDSNL